MLTRPRLACVWFDPMAAVFVHARTPTRCRSRGRLRRAALRPDPRPSRTGPPRCRPRPKAPAATCARSDPAARPAPAAARWSCSGTTTRGGSGRPTPTAAEAGSCSASSSSCRDPPAPRRRRRAVPHAVRPGLRPLGRPGHLRPPPRPSDSGRDDFTDAADCSRLFETRGMIEARPPLLERLVAAAPRSSQRSQCRQRVSRRARRAIGSAPGSPPPPSTWKNLERARPGRNRPAGSRPGRVAAADFLERAYPAERADRGR